MTDIADYKGYHIEVNDEGIFHAYTKAPLTEGGGWEQVAEAKSLDALHKSLDTVAKTRLPTETVFVQVNNEGFLPGKITGIIKSSYGISLRVSYRAHRGYGRNEEYPSWSSFDPGQIIKDTPENRERVTAYNALKKQISKAEHDKHALVEQMTAFTEKELVGQ